MPTYLSRDKFCPLDSDCKSPRVSVLSRTIFAWTGKPERVDYECGCIVYISDTAERISVCGADVFNRVAPGTLHLALGECKEWVGEPTPLDSLQATVVEWEGRNFGVQPAYRRLLGIAEEVGELCHHHLKDEQGVRTNEDHIAEIKDALGDMVVYALTYCGCRGWSLQQIIEETVAQVVKRDWNANKETGNVGDAQETA